MLYIVFSKIECDWSGMESVVQYTSQPGTALMSSIIMGTGGNVVPMVLLLYI